MWNMDEKGFKLGITNRAKVIARTGRHPPRATYDCTCKLITVIECCGARLKMLVPIVVFKGSAHYHGWHSEVTKCAPGYFTYSPKGYSTSEIGLEWLRKFNAETTPTHSTEYRLLLLDGHHSHYNLPFCEYAWDNKMILMSYPGNSIHLLQPLDAGLFAPL